MRVTVFNKISPLLHRRLHKRAPTIRTDNLLIVEHTSRSSQKQNTRRHIAIMTSTTCWIAHARLVNLRLLITAAVSCGHLLFVSILFEAPRHRTFVHTSLGNTPGAILLTLTFVSAKVVANILVKCNEAALLLA